MKNLIVAGIIGLAFMAGGFWYGLRLKPLPTPQSQAALAKAEAAAAKPPAPPPISLETLKKTSETMMSLNEALEVREKAVAEREQKVAQREDELAAERTALDASHAKFKDLFNQFQQRLELVEANEADQLQKQSDLYIAMGTAQAIDLIRAKDDEAMVKLFSVTDTKPLAKLIADWKTKYPEDVPRLLHVLDAMAKVMPKEKIALTEPQTTPDSGAPDSAPPADNSTPAPTPVPDSTSAPADTSNPAPAPAPTDSNATTPAANPAPDASTSNTPPAQGDVPVAPSADPNGASPVALPLGDPSTIPPAPGAPATPPSPPPLAPPPDSKHSGPSTADANW